MELVFDKGVINNYVASPPPQQTVGVTGSPMNTARKGGATPKITTRLLKEEKVERCANFLNELKSSSAYFNYKQGGLKLPQERSNSKQQLTALERHELNKQAIERKIN